jgi:hypothetical protein
MFNTIYQGMEYLVNAASGGMALAKDDIKIADYINFAQQSLEQLIRLARQVSELFAKRKEIKLEQQEEAEKFTGNVKNPMNPDKAAENHATAVDYFGENISNTLRENIANQARSDDPETKSSSQFLKDLTRDMDLEVGGVKVPNRDPDGNLLEDSNIDGQHALHQQANEIIRGFLAGDDESFRRPLSELSAEQKQQIYIVEALCTQILAIAARTANSIDTLGEGNILMRDTNGNSPEDEYKFVMTKDAEGNIVVTLTSTAHADALSGDTAFIELDSNNSTNKATGSFSISKKELRRLSGLNWTDTSVPPAQLPDNYKPKFMNKSFKGKISLWQRQ